MLFMTAPARLFKGAVIADFVLHPSSDCLVAIETFFIWEIPGIIMTFCAVIRNFLYLMGLGKFVRRYHHIEFLGDRHLLGQEVALCSHTTYEEGGRKNQYRRPHGLLFFP